MELVTFHFDIFNVYCVYKQNNRGSNISRVAGLSLGLTAGTYRNSEYRKIMRFSVYLYYTQPSTGPLLLVKIMHIVFEFLR